MPAARILHESDHPFVILGRTANPAKNVFTPPVAVHFYIPRSFNPANFSELTGLHDEAYWLVHKILALHIAYRHDHKGWVNISQQTIREFIHPSHARKVQYTLLSKGVIQCNGSYKKGRHSMGWRIGPAYRGSIRRVKVTKKSLVAKMLRHRIRVGDKPVSESQLNATHSHLLASLRRVKIDTTQAYPLATLRARKIPRKARKIGRRGRVKIVRAYRRSLCRVTIDQIADQSFDFTVDRQGRVHTPVTRLFTEARSCLSIDGKPLVSIDIANSQLIFFTLMLLESRYHKIAEGDDISPSISALSSPSCTKGESVLASISALSSPISTLSSPSCTKGESVLEPDEQEFVKMVMDGSIYPHLLEEYNELVGPGPDTITSRRDFKGLFFQQVLYGDNDRFYASNTPMAALFREAFPSVWEFICDQKQWHGDGDSSDAFKSLSVRMQARESRFMIGRVCGRLQQHHAEIPLLTIHDSIMTIPEHVETVHRIMTEEFARLGIKPKIRVET